MLPFGSLNHAQDHGIDGQTACLLLEGERTYGRHSIFDAIDPERTPAALQEVPGSIPGDTHQFR